MKPENFGAKGDGRHNDGPSFQRALDALAAHRQGKTAPGSAEVLGPGGEVVTLVRVEVIEEAPPKDGTSDA